MSLPASSPPPAPAPTTSAAVPKDPEREWLETVYQRGARQLTVRATLAGMVIGAVMCLSNLYIVLKTGWSFGVTITSCILAFGFFELLQKARLVKREFTVLENNAMSSVASAAGYMTGGGNMAAVPALFMLTGALPSGGWLVAWFAVISALGVFAAIPIKRQLINIEKLPFPTGTATAEVLRSLHGDNAEAREKSRLLWQATGLAALVTFFKDFKAAWWPAVLKLQETFGLGLKLQGEPITRWSLGLNSGLLLIGAGMLISFKTGWSMLLGALLNFGLLAPEMVERGVIGTVSYRAIVGWTVWLGAAIIVSSGLLSFAFEWRSIARVFAGLGGLLGKKPAGDDPVAQVEAPPTWFPLGFLLLGPVAVFLMAHLFDIPWWAGLIALPLSVVMGVIASRVTGETDTTPTKALGPVTQLTYGAVLPGHLAANVMSANVTGGVGLHAADLLTDLKSGYLLGANPRQQFFAQLFGVVAGAAVIVPIFFLIVPTAAALGTQDLPAPAAMVWKSVSEVMVKGVGALHPTAVTAAYIGIAVGVLLTLLERFAPARMKRFVPSASGLGLAIVIPGKDSISLFLGAALAAGLRKWRPGLGARAILPVSAGFIAGESLLGIVIKILEALKVIG